MPGRTAVAPFHKTLSGSLLGLRENVFDADEGDREQEHR